MVADVDLEVPDGARTHVTEIAGGFARAGAPVFLIARGRDPRLPGVTFTRAAGAEDDRITRVATINLLAIRTLWNRRRDAARFYVRNKWSIVPAALAARLLGYRVVTEVDDLPFGRGYAGEIARSVDYVKRLALFVMGRLSVGLVAGTDQARETIVTEFHVPQARVAVVPIGVDLEFFHPMDRDQAIRRDGLDPALRYAIFLGNFANWVDFDTLLRAFALVAERRGDVRLLLVGDGEGRAEIEATAARLRISDRVIITGFVHDRDRLRDFLGSATIALAAHRPEHLDRIGVNATKLAEYMACGLPIVALEVRGLRTIEDAGAGLVATGPDAFAAAIETALESPTADELGAGARRLAVRQHSWDATVARTLSLFGR
jgi:glycosyltransferase involved in cell wall biosynthesis